MKRAVKWTLTVDQLEKGRSTSTSSKRQVEKGRMTSTTIFQPGRRQPAFFNLVDVDLPFSTWPTSTCLFLVVDHEKGSVRRRPGRSSGRRQPLPFSWLTAGSPFHHALLFLVHNE